MALGQRDRRPRRLATLFLLCSHKGMDKIDPTRVAETLLSAPGWARVGLTASVGHLRIAAAHELARAILEDVGQDTDGPAGDQLGLLL
jgi:hypothetical protein